MYSNHLPLNTSQNHKQFVDTPRNEAVNCSLPWKLLCVHKSLLRLLGNSHLAECFHIKSELGTMLANCKSDNGFVEYKPHACLRHDVS
jgi:hypothetical protein